MMKVDPAEVRAHLVAAAAAGRPLTYSELLDHLGYGFSRPKMRQLCKLLAAVDAAAEAADEPELAVLVVRQSDGIPGQGWWVTASQEGRGYHGPWHGVAAQRYIASLQQRAFDYWAGRV